MLLSALRNSLRFLTAKQMEMLRKARARRGSRFWKTMLMVMVTIMNTGSILSSVISSPGQACLISLKTSADLTLAASSDLEESRDLESDVEEDTEEHGGPVVAPPHLPAHNTGYCPLDRRFSHAGLADGDVALDPNRQHGGHRDTQRDLDTTLVEGRKRRWTAST